MIAKRDGSGGMSEIGRKSKRHKPVVTKYVSHEDEMYSMGKRLNNNVISLYDDRS